MRVRGVTLVVACATAATACSSSAPTATPRPSTHRVELAAQVAACHRPHQAGHFARLFKFKGKRRTFQLFVPKAYKGTTRVPLVFNFHGFGSSAEQQMLYGDFAPQAKAHDFLIVAPDGQGRGARRHFSAGLEPGLQNDLIMTQSLLTHVEHAYCIDAKRVYATGMSDGGAITTLLACAAPNKFAAFAPVAAVVFCGAKGGRPIALASFQGTADPVVPYGGGVVQCCRHSVVPPKPVTMAKWAAYDKCAKKYTDTRLGSEVVRRKWKSCAKRGTVVLYIIETGGHTWPGAWPQPGLGHTTRQIKASDVIWKFFAAHKLAS